MNPVDRLIVALDVPPDDARSLVIQLKGKANNFKLGVGTFLSPGGFAVARFTTGLGRAIMLDLKLYDTKDTVKRTMEVVAKLGATWVTVHADCVEHAMGFGPKVLIVNRLTDGTGKRPGPKFSLYDAMKCDGFVCDVETAAALHPPNGRLIVCPGIRTAGSVPDNHYRPATPREAIEGGADYIVVGRPIYAAADPVAAAHAIIDEIGAASAVTR